jgi:AraC-like DNA-binding protein
MSYEQYLDQLVDVIFSKAAKKYTWEELADQAGLSRRTVYNLGMRVTRFPQLRTVYLLSRVVNVLRKAA